MRKLITITLAALLTACGCGVEELPVTVKVEAPLLVETPVATPEPILQPEPIMPAPTVPEPLPPKKDDVTEISVETDRPMPD